MSDIPETLGTDQPGVVGAHPLALLRSSTLFVGVPEEELETIATRLQTVNFAQGDTIIREGEAGDACFVIGGGQAGVVSRDMIGEEVTLATFGPGACFGEVALVTEGPRTATVRALEPVEAYVLHRNDFERLAETCPAFASHVRSRVDILAVDSFLRKASPFAHLPSDAIRRLAGQLRSERFAPGSVIITEGEEGDRFYLVRQGSVEVLRDGRRLQVLEAGDNFGEVALLAEVKRTATVRAVESTELLSLSKDDFTAVVGEHDTLRGQFTEFIRIRVGDAIARTVNAADPIAALMPDLPNSRRKRYWWILLMGVLMFAGLSYAATETHNRYIVYVAIIVGSFVGPVVDVMYLSESHLLPDKPLNLVITFVLAAAIGIPLAIEMERMTGARAGSLGPALMVGIIEETVKILGVAWILRRATSRFQMDGVIYGAAAGMGFAAFENIIYGINRVDMVSGLLSTLWFRMLLSPFGHGTWTAIIAAAIWRGKSSGSWIDWRVGAAFATSVGLHALWDWQPVDGFLLLVWLLVIGLVGVEILRSIVEEATRETAGAVIALNPQAVGASASAAKINCRVCGQESPPGTRYCVRCGAALRQTRAT